MRPGVVDDRRQRCVLDVHELGGILGEVTAERVAVLQAAEVIVDEEIRAASLQYVRKVSGFNKPSKANEAVFLAAVDEIAAVSRKLLNALETSAPPRNREEEAAKARARSALRFPT